MRSGKIQECQQKLQETWTLAREEAAKCKAAKEVIKALSSRVISIHCFFSWLIAMFRIKSVGQAKILFIY